MDREELDKQIIGKRKKKGRGLKMTYVSRKVEERGQEDGKKKGCR